MKLSEAINLGAHTVEHPEKLILGRCALGMASNAQGISAEYNCIREQWTWLNIALPSAPCGCRHLAGQDALFVIAHIFDAHVMGDQTAWTLEQLVDYVRSIEPAEESNLPDISLAEQYRAEEEAAAEEGALTDGSGYNDPMFERNGR